MILVKNGHDTMESDSVVSCTKQSQKFFHFFIVIVVVTRAYLRSGQDYAWVLRVAIPTM